MMKQVRLHRIFLIMILALGMTGGSFIASMAAVEADIIPEIVDPVAEIAQQDEILGGTDTEDVVLDSDAANNQEAQNLAPEDADVDVHGDDCEHCKAQEEKESTSEVIKAVQQVAPVVISTPAANIVEKAPGLDENNQPEQGSGNGDNVDPPLENEDEENSVPQQATVPEIKEPPAKPEVTPGKINGHPAEVEWGKYVEPTCEEGGYYEVTYWCKNRTSYCTIKEPYYGYLGTDKIYVTEALGHTPGEPVEENHIEATAEQAGSYDEVVYCEICNKELSRETIHVEFYAPKLVVIDDPIFGDAHVAEIDNSGRAVIKDFFINLKTGGSAKETITMQVAGKSYTFTVYSDGTVSGKLPKGFSISGRDLIITGASDSLDIEILDRGATSSISEDPVLDEDEGAGYQEPTYTPPIDEHKAPVPIAEGTADNIATAATTTSNTNVANTANNPVEDQLATAEEALESPSILADLFGSQDSNNENGSIGEKIGVTPSKLLIAADIALVAGLIIGLCALWKLGILKF